MHPGHTVSIAAVVFSALFTATTSSWIPPREAPAELKSLIRRDHPRLFLNDDFFPNIKARALNEKRAEFDRMRARADKLAVMDSLASDDYGAQASEAAFVWLVTEEDRYLTLATRRAGKTMPG